MKKTILFLIIATAIFGGCKRFEDGPTISLCSVKSRITGTWKVDKFYIDGVDSTDEYYSKLGCEIEFTRQKNGGSNRFWKIYFKNCNNGNTLLGQWDFYAKDIHLIEFDIHENTDFNYAIGPVGSKRGAIWKILRLTNHEFNLTVENYYDFSSPGPNHTFTYLIKLKK